MAEKTYSGSCQCQSVQFEAPLDLDQAMVCNCSRCQRLGWIVAFAPRAKVTISRGEGATTEYLFNRRLTRHQFCPTCGIEPFAFLTRKEGPEMVAVNVNCLDGVDPRALRPKPVDGRSF